MLVILSSKSKLVWGRGGGRGAQENNSFPLEPLKRKGFHSLFLFHLVPNSPSFPILPPTSGQRNGSRAAGFSLQQLTYAGDDGLGYSWHLLAIADYVSTVCFLKEGLEWWLCMPFVINFPEPKTQYV